MLDYPIERLHLKGFGGRVQYAQFLHDGSEIQFGKPMRNASYQEDLESSDLILILPVVKPDIEIPVVELIMNDEPDSVAYE